MFYIILIKTLTTFRLGHIEDKKTETKLTIEQITKYVEQLYGETSHVWNILTVKTRYDVNEIYEVLKGKYFKWYHSDTRQIDFDDKHIEAVIDEDSSRTTKKEFEESLATHIEKRVAWVQKQLESIYSIVQLTKYQYDLQYSHTTLVNDILNDRFALMNKQPNLKTLETYHGVVDNSFFGVSSRIGEDHPTPLTDNTSMLNGYVLQTNQQHLDSAELEAVYGNSISIKMDIYWDTCHRLPIYVSSNLTQNGRCYYVQEGTDCEMTMDYDEYCIFSMWMEMMNMSHQTVSIRQSMKHNVLNVLMIEEYENEEECIERVKQANTEITQEQLKSWMKENYVISTNMNERILYSQLLSSIEMKFAIDYGIDRVEKGYSLPQQLRKLIPYVFQELGLSKKRYRDGVFWYGLKPVEEDCMARQVQQPMYEYSALVN